MQRRVFGPTGRRVAVVGQGTWKIHHARHAREALARGLQLGMDHVDTAELYQGAEETISPLLVRDREKVFLVSKVLPAHADRRGTVRACEGSLDRLETSYLDVYLLHWPGPHAVEETMHAMAGLIDEGMIRYAGVSNFDVPEMEAARDALGGHPLACNQVLYHPAARDAEVEVLPWCKRHGVAMVGYSPFGSDHFPGGVDGRHALHELGQRHGKTAHQVILDVLSRDSSVFLIPKAETVAHVEENAAALEMRLPADAVAAFDELFPVPERVAGVPTL